MKWWEKTVEYTFVLEAAQKGIFNLFMPLDGDVESIGDTVVCTNSKYFILEFKKTLSDLSGEYKKYEGGKAGFSKAANELKDMPAYQAHFLIGGKIGTKRHLEIQVSHYFEHAITDGIFSNTFQKGVSLKEMKEYSEKLTTLKTLGTEIDTNGSSSGGFYYESVLAISMSGKTATLIPLKYFKNFNLTKKYTLSPN
ncbi:hypothetical protein NRL00_01860 [Aeromonas dhakensis]|uniref:hypothetical protein n=1 Tax=Aeromonas dhakensis TaxID=196024 RepID=UPI00227C09DE|nr:hypothetical protein [Aeromonas dhakensis]WAF77360.1 hypothetical protein NRL00_01860 [Aeromonas dhakensis]HDO1320900.1 hypothetical protein [Aeromonas veronii]HDO1323081.1 hypothetical protein [Aeromonas veronii]